MQNFFVTGNNILVTEAFIQKTDAEINGTLLDGLSTTFGNLNAGTLIHSPGYATVKEKSLDGSWVEL